MQTNLNPTDPAYLRTIYDGLLLGTLHKDNASALPMGLVGMYEEALPPASNVNERKKFLKFFSVWALLKKEVSVAFLMPLLEGWSEEIIIYYLNKYSKWFNSPQSGKYVLYHERLRAFILQKTTKLIEQNLSLLNCLLKYQGKNETLKIEIVDYLQIYYGDHLFISAIYKTIDDSSFKFFIRFDETIKEKKWLVKDKDLMRWNANLAFLASIDADVNLLKQVFVFQDKIINKTINFDTLLDKVIKNELDELNDIILYKSDHTEKYIIILGLIIHLINRIEQMQNDTIENDSNLLNFSLNKLLKIINALDVIEEFVICEGLVEEVNFKLILSALYVGNIEEELSNNGTPGEEAWADLPSPHYIGTKKEDEYFFNFYSADNLINRKHNESQSDEYIKEELLKLVDDILPSYHGIKKNLKEIKKKTNNYSLALDKDGIQIKSIILEIKDAIALTGSDNDYVFNTCIESVVYELFMFNFNFTKIKWVSCFCNPIEYVSIINYYTVISYALHSKKWNSNIIFGKSWESKKHLLHVSIAAANILCKQGKTNAAFDLYKKTIEIYTNYSYTKDINIRFSSYLSIKKLSKKHYSEIIKTVKSLEYIHVKTLSSVLCLETDFLNLVKTLNYDDIYLSGVSANKSWAYEILSGITLRLGLKKTEIYLLNGLEEYVSIMGKFKSKEYDRESNRPKKNIWKIEWWVMANFITIFHELADELHLDQWSNYSSNDYGAEITWFNDDSFYNTIEEIFNKYNCDPEVNLYKDIEEYKNIGPNKLKENECDAILNYMLNPLSVLLNFTLKQQDKSFINNISNLIRKGI